KEVYAKYGIDWQDAQAALVEAIGDDQRRERMKESTDIFRVLIKTLLKAGIITERTRDGYAMWVDMEELASEGDRMVGDDIAEEGIKYLQEINFKDRARQILIAAE
ncbi:MAG: ferritin-like domain-containing protein, partial [Phenylobacterium sp.]